MTPEKPSERRETRLPEGTGFLVCDGPETNLGVREARYDLSDLGAVRSEPEAVPVWEESGHVDDSIVVVLRGGQAHLTRPAPCDLLAYVGLSAPSGLLSRLVELVAHGDLLSGENVSDSQGKDLADAQTATGTQSGDQAYATAHHGFALHEGQASGMTIGIVPDFLRLLVARIDGIERNAVPETDIVRLGEPKPRSKRHATRRSFVCG